MTSSPRKERPSRIAALDVATLPAGLAVRAVAHDLGVRAVARRRRAGRAARALVQADGRRARRRQRDAAPPNGDRARRVRRGDVVPANHEHARPARFRDKVTIALESHVARLQASIATIAHQEVPEYLDRIAMLRDQVFVLDHMYMAVFSMAGWILRLAVTIALLVSVHPGARAPDGVRAARRCSRPPGVPASSAQPRSAAAPFNRLARHLFATATTATAGQGGAPNGDR